MKEKLKEFTFELIGFILIGIAFNITRDVRNAGVEGGERFAIILLCALVATIGVKLIKKAAKCTK